MLRIACCLVVVACGSSGGGAPATSATTSAVTTPAEPSARERDAQRQREDKAETERREQITATHRVAELEQQTAMAASCDEPKPWNKHERCLPSCYPTEDADARAETKLAGPSTIEHVVCRGAGEIPYMIIDAVGGAKLKVKKARGRFPKPPKKGSWQAEVVAWLQESAAKLPRTDVVVIKGSWANRPHPLSREKLSCVTVTRFSRALRGKLDECGAPARSGVTCEAAGNAAARGINVVHYRLVEAKRLQAAGKREACQQAALEAIAVARGLPRWRQYKKLNVDEWNDKLVYKTRFDGILDEDTLFARAAVLGSEAEAVFASCGGTSATTTVEQEQSFHMCW